MQSLNIFKGKDKGGTTKMAIFKKKALKNSSIEAPQSKKRWWLMVWVGVIFALFSISLVGAITTEGMQVYYPFDDKDDLYNTLDWVDGDGSPTFQTASCLIGDCVNTSAGNNLIINQSNSIFDVGADGDRTMNFWIRPSSESYAIGIFNVWYMTTVSGVWNFALCNGGAGATVTMDTWHMITITTNGTLETCYINGTYRGTGAGASTSTVATELGEAQGNDIEALFDEFVVWNRTLTGAEVVEVYNSGAGLSYSDYAIPTLSVGLVTPTNNSVISTVGTNFSANYSMVLYPYNWTNGTYYVWNSTGILNNTELVSISGLTNTSIKYIDGFTYGNYEWNVFACYGNATYSNCTFADSNYTFEVGATADAESYNNLTYETSTEIFQMNVSVLSGSQLYQARLFYNNTYYIGTLTDLGGDKYHLERTLTTPLVTAQTDVPFHWNISFNNEGTLTQVFSRNQTVFPLPDINVTIQDCPSGYSPSLNFSFGVENNLSRLAVDVEYNFNFGIGNLTLKVINGSLTTVHSFVLCINSSIDTYRIGYGEIQYSSEGFTDRRYYIFDTYRLTNTTISLPLSSLDTALSTSFLLTAQSTTLIPYENHYVGLLRWYPEINSYRTVEMGRTDDKGQTVFHVKTEDVDYKLALYEYDGDLVYLSNPIRMICQTTPCIYTLFIDTTELDLTTFTNIQKSLTFDSATGIFTFIWNDPSQASQTMNLSVYQDTGTSSTIICSSSSTSYTGTLICDVSAYTGTLRAEVVRVASSPTIIAQLTQIIRDTFIDAGGGAIGLFFGALMVIIFALVGIFNPIIAIILSMLSFLFLLFLGNISLLVFSAIAVLGGVVLHFLGRTR